MLVFLVNFKKTIDKPMKKILSVAVITLIFLFEHLCFTQIVSKISKSTKFQKFNQDGIEISSPIMNDTLVVWDSLIYQTWDTSRSIWVKKQKQVFTYDGSGFNTGNILQRWQNTFWMNSTKFIYKYDFNGNASEYLLQNWDGSQWVNWVRYVYTYDTVGNMLEEKSQEWHRDGWLDSRRYLYLYDDSGNVIDDIYQTFYNNEWINYEKNIYSFDNKRNMIENIFLKWQVDKWTNSKRTYNTYDNNSKVTEQLNQDWKDTAWINRYNSFYSYSDGKTREILTLFWVVDSWKNSSLVTYAFDLRGINTEKLSKIWTNSEWKNNTKNSYTNDNRGNKTEDWSQQWNGLSWRNVSKIIYTWQQLITDVADEPSTPTTFTLQQNYPNPFNPVTVINYQLQTKSDVMLKIYDVLGREVVTLVDETQPAGKNSVRWDATNMPSGVYYYRLQAGQYSEMKKLVLAK